MTYEEEDKNTHPIDHQKVTAILNDGSEKICVFVGGQFYIDDSTPEAGPQLAAIDGVVSWS